MWRRTTSLDQKVVNTSVPQVWYFAHRIAGRIGHRFLKLKARFGHRCSFIGAHFTCWALTLTMATFIFVARWIGAAPGPHQSMVIRDYYAVKGNTIVRRCR